MVQRANKEPRVKAIHAKVANTRKDFLHKETAKIANAFGLVCVGNVSGPWLQGMQNRLPMPARAITAACSKIAPVMRRETFSPWDVRRS